MQVIHCSHISHIRDKQNNWMSALCVHAVGLCNFTCSELTAAVSRFFISTFTLLLGNSLVVCVTHRSPRQCCNRCKSSSDHKMRQRKAARGLFIFDLVPFLFYERLFEDFSKLNFYLSNSGREYIYLHFELCFYECVISLIQRFFFPRHNLN